MHRLLALLVFFSLAPPVCGQSLTLWQGETRHRLEPSTEIWLDRAPFTLLLTATADQALKLTAGPAPGPDNYDSFGEARGMATGPGPYPGLFLDWEANHYLFYQQADDSRMLLWKSLDDNRKVFYWHVRSIQSWQGGQMLPLAWDKVPNLEVRLQYPGRDPWSFFIKWRYR